MRTIVAIAALASAPAAERVITDTTLAADVGGAPLRLLIDPGAPAMPIISAEAAARAGLKAGPFAIGYRVGPVTVAGRSAVGRIGRGGAPAKRRIGWTSAPYAAGYDGAIGPGGLPEPVVRFVLGPARAGERTVALPMESEGSIFGNWGAANAVVMVGGTPVRVRFSLRHEASIATAGAALTLANALGGTLDEGRSEAEIAFGVKRPVRPLRLAQPLEVGPIRLTNLLARTGDFGNAEGIAATGTAADPDEIVVTAKGERDTRRDRILIGRAALAGCSSLVYDKPARQVRLTCA